MNLGEHVMKSYRVFSINKLLCLINEIKLYLNYFLSELFFFSDEGDRPLDLCGCEVLEDCSSLTPLKISSKLFKEKWVNYKKKLKFTVYL